MKKTMLKINDLFILVLTMLASLMISFIFIGNTNTVWAASYTQISQVKEYWSGTIYEDFDDSSVLVVMDKQTSGINKSHEDSFFGTFSREAVYDLTFTNKKIKNIDTDDFNQILQIKLSKGSKQNVVNVIRELE